MVSGDGGTPSPAVDVTDETLVVASASSVRDRLCDEARWEAMIPGIRLSCIDDRGSLGKRWSVSGSLSGSAEVWLEPWADSVVAHVFLQVDPSGGGVSARAAERLRRRYALRIKQEVSQIKATLEAGRAAGTPRQG